MLAALAGPERVVYVSGFSKSITPSMRVGYIVAAPALLDGFAKIKMTMGLTTPEMMERVAYQLLRLGRHASHLARVRARLRAAHNHLYALMDSHGFWGFSWPRPRRIL